MAPKLGGAFVDGCLEIGWLSSRVRSMKLCKFFDEFDIFGGRGLDWKMGLAARGVVQVTFSGRLMLTEPC
jgi:hypothetical protein